MFLIAGLGNPTAKYEHTRHNVGFDVIDRLAEKYHIEMREHKFKALIGKGTIEGHPVLLAKPQTFMNLSGESIGEIVRWYKLDPSRDMIILSDDVTLGRGNHPDPAEGKRRRSQWTQKHHCPLWDAGFPSHSNRRGETGAGRRYGGPCAGADAAGGSETGRGFL